MLTGKRAWLYVLRNKKRTALLFLLFTALMTISLLGLALRAASRDAGRELRGSIGGYFMIQTAANSSENVTDRLLQQVQGLENIGKTNGVDTYYLYTEGLQLKPGSQHGTGLPGEFTPKFIGCIDSSLHEQFVSVSFQLKEGRHITADDKGKAVISEYLAAQNDLVLGDTISGSVVQGVRGWPQHALGTEGAFEIIGIYSTMRSEVASPQTPESDLQENIIFTDIATAKDFYHIKFPDKPAEEYAYSSGIMLFLDDPARMEETVENMNAQPFADWDGFIISENNAAYAQAAGAIGQAEQISLLLLIIIVALSVGILALVLLMWTRERMTEFGILISLGVPAKGILGQIVLENYLVAVPAFAASVVLSIALGSVLNAALGGMLQGASIAGYIGITPATIVLLCAAAVIALAVLLASGPIVRKKPKEILTDLS